MCYYMLLYIHIVYEYNKINMNSTNVPFCHSGFSTDFM